MHSSGSLASSAIQLMSSEKMHLDGITIFKWGKPLETNTCVLSLCGFSGANWVTHIKDFPWIKVRLANKSTSIFRDFKSSHSTLDTTQSRKYLLPFNNFWKWWFCWEIFPVEIPYFPTFNMIYNPTKRELSHPSIWNRNCLYVGIAQKNFADWNGLLILDGRVVVSVKK